jgi:nitrite reductase/ring-hydroxylating ferredoxin subunit
MYGDSAMIAHGSRNRSHSPGKRGADGSLQRERLAWLAGSATLILLVSSMALLVGMLLYKTSSAGLVDTLPVDRVRADVIVHIDRAAANGRGFFLVRTSDGILALSEIPSHPRALPVVWIASSKLFVDSALGCSFTRDGSYVRGPCIRNLDRYPIAGHDGRVVVDTAHPTPGIAHN